MCVDVCVCPTTVEERLQQLLLGQALVHLHPHDVTAEPLRLLLGLGGRGRMSEDAEARWERVVMETMKM